MVTFWHQDAAPSWETQLTSALIRCRAYLVGTSQRSRRELAAIFDDANATKLLLPPCQIENEGDVEALSEKVAILLVGRPELPEFHAEVSGVFEELVMNAVQHSPRQNRKNWGKSDAARRRGACYAMLEYSASGSQKLFSVAVRDTGVGIRASLRNNRRNFRRFSIDGGEIEYATELGSTGTQEERGIGLNYVKIATTTYNGCLVIASDKGCIISAHREIETIEYLKDIVQPWTGISGTFIFAGLFVPVNK